MRPTSRKVELLANLAILALALLLGVLTVRRYFFPPAASPPRATLEPAVLVGNRLTLPGVDWGTSARTVLLALSTHCHYCTESAPFYQRLAHALAQRADNTRLLAVLPEERAESRRYLQTLGLGTADVQQAALPAIGIRGTPTLLVLDNTGAVVNAWVGQLNAPDERDVWRALQLLDDRTPAAAESPGINAQELRAALARREPVLLLDVRARTDFAREHLPGARNIPFDELGVRAPEELHPAGRVVIYADCVRCPGEGQAIMAQQALLELGFRETYVLRGGLAAWRQAAADRR